MNNNDNFLNNINCIHIDLETLASLIKELKYENDVFPFTLELRYENLL